jgi:hypothetical protein
MLRVPAKIAIEAVAHVYELLGDDNFKRSRMRLVNARKVDQDEMMVGLLEVCIRAADRRAHTPPEPALEHPALRRDPETIDGQAQELYIPFDKLVHFRVIHVPTHNGDLPGRQEPTISASGGRGGYVRGTPSSYRMCGNR